MIRFSLISVLLVAGACSQSPAIADDKSGCLNEVETLRSERASHISQRLAELERQILDDPEYQAVVRQRAETTTGADEPDLAVANRKLGQILALMEQEPQLKYTEQFAELMAEIEMSENRLAIAVRDCPEARKHLDASSDLPIGTSQ